jgi:ASC-1-like (ASCH) protein
MLAYTYTNYQEKYQKYKSKYLKLKKFKGGSEFKITIKDPWFTYIKEGIKTVEGRLNKSFFTKLNVGDKVVWINRNNHINTVITKIIKYKTFEEMLTNEGLEKVLPDPKIKTISDGVNIYRQYYASNVEKEHGVLAIHIKKN